MLAVDLGNLSALLFVVGVVSTSLAVLGALALWAGPPVALLLRRPRAATAPERAPRPAPSNPEDTARTSREAVPFTVDLFDLSLAPEDLLDEELEPFELIPLAEALEERTLS